MEPRDRPRLLARRSEVLDAEQTGLAGAVVVIGDEERPVLQRQTFPFLEVIPGRRTAKAISSGAGVTIASGANGPDAL